MTRKLKLSIEIIIERANIIFNNKYDYSKSIYTSYLHKMRVGCPHHGDFLISAKDHLWTRRECPKCAKKHRLTTAQFIENAVKIHGGLYDYSKSLYTNAHSPVEIICNIHGVFFQKPTNHISGKNGCPKCCTSFVLTYAGFIDKAKEIHSNFYNYSLVEYRNASTNVNIICPNHGDFHMWPSVHIAGRGCKQCGFERVAAKLRQPLDIFIGRANEIHNSYYDYSEVVLVNYHRPIIIKCPTHGGFLISPDNHIYSKQGCKSCNVSLENKWLNSLGILEEHRRRRLKLVNGRYIIPDAYVPETNTIYEFWGDYWHGNSNIYRPTDVSANNGKTFGQLYKETQDKRSLILSTGYNLVEIWESEFNYEQTKKEFIEEIKMAKLSQENITRLRQLIRDGVAVMQEVEDLREGLRETVKAISEELECKPSQINNLIKIHQKGTMEEKRESWEEMEDLYKSSL